MDAHADAEVGYAKRKAELKAEAEHADARLELLDKKVKLTSLGFREVARKVVPNVVNVVNFRKPGKEDADPAAKLRPRLVYDPDDDGRYILQSHGSGVIYKPGVILTNYHVVRDAHRLRITFASGRSVGVNIDAAALDQRTDLAVIRLPDTMSEPLKDEAKQNAMFADSEKDLEVGDWTIAVGSPSDYRQSVTQGIVSAKGRKLSLNEWDMVELIQTDAAINPGNSGGPLFDQLGRVVGINVAIAVEERGIGFAIPSNTAKKIAEQLLKSGEVARGYLGITMEELPGPELKANKIDDGAIVIKQVVKGEAAFKAGIKAGDIITGVNKEPLARWKSLRHFRQLVVDLEPGAEVTLDIIRAEERRQIAVTVGKRPKDLP
jgi:S1-C subfamily serine protease